MNRFTMRRLAFDKKSRPGSSVWVGLVLALGGCSSESPTSAADPKPPEISIPGPGEATTNVRLRLPAGSSIAPASLKLVAGVHEARNNGAIGLANLDTSVVQLLVAADGSGAPALLGVVAGHATGDVILDATATAEALVLLSPMLATSDPAASRQTLTLIRASSRFAALSNAVSAKISTGSSGWLAQDDPTLAAAVAAVVLDVQPRLATVVGSARLSTSVPVVVGSNSRNGITVTGVPGTDGYSVKIENSRGRWLSVVARLSDDNQNFGKPLDPPGFGPWLPTLISSSKLINLIVSKPDATVNLGSTFSKARIKVFGLGFGSGGPSAFGDVDAGYVIFPATATVVFDVGIPIVQMVLGVKNINATVPSSKSAWQWQWTRLTVNCLAGVNNSLDLNAIPEVVTATFENLVSGRSLIKFAVPTLKCAFTSAAESEAVLLAILTSVGKAGALSTVINNISFLKLPFLLWGAVDLGKTAGEIAASDALTVFDIVDTGPLRVFAASIAGSLLNSTGPSELYSVGATTGGSDRLIGRLRTTTGVEPAITDLALTPGGKLWAISFTRLYSVDTLTGALTDIGSLGHTDVNALAAHANGSLYGGTLLSGVLIRVDPATGASTIIGFFGNGLVSNGDMAFAPDGRLFGALRTSGGSTFLASINQSTGAATPIGSGSGIGFNNVWGLTFVGSQLFGLTTDAIGRGTLISIDLTTGQGTTIRPLAFNAGGAGVRESMH